MHKGSLLVLVGLVLGAASYQILASDSMAVADRTTNLHELQIVTRNAALTAFTRAKHLVEDAAGFEPFAPPGVHFRGDYEGAAYRAHILSDGATVTIFSSAEATTDIDTVDFSVSAQVEWAPEPSAVQGSGGERYLVLKAYHED